MHSMHSKILIKYIITRIMTKQEWLQKQNWTSCCKKENRKKTKKCQNEFEVYKITIIE